MARRILLAVTLLVVIRIVRDAAGEQRLGLADLRRADADRSAGQLQLRNRRGTCESWRADGWRTVVPTSFELQRQR